jgi:hypothetical protein
MAGISQITGRVRLAIRRTRLGVLWMGCAYATGLIVGLLSVHPGTPAESGVSRSNRFQSSRIVTHSPLFRPGTFNCCGCSRLRWKSGRSNTNDRFRMVCSRAYPPWHLPRLGRGHRLCGPQSPKPIQNVEGRRVLCFGCGPPIGGLHTHRRSRGNSRVSSHQARVWVQWPPPTGRSRRGLYRCRLHVRARYSYICICLRNRVPLENLVRAPSSTAC